MELTVQICTYNRVDRLPACLDALARQACAPVRFDVVLVDDGSDEPVAAHLDLARYPFVRLVRIPHGGLARARNAGIRAAAGDVVLFIDDDTIADQRLVDEHWRAHQQWPHSVVLGWVNHVDGTVPSGAPASGPPRRRLRLADLSTSFFWTSNVSVRRDDLFAAGLFDEAFTEYGWEDVEFGERLRALGLRRRVISGAIVSHVKRPWHAGNVPGLLKQAEASGRSAVIFVRKRPTLRARLATGIGPVRMAANRALESGEPWFRRKVERASEHPLRGLDWMAAYLLTRAAYFRSVRAALANPVAPPLRNIVVIRTDKIGDLLVSTPAIRGLRCAYPAARITLLAGSSCGDVLRGWDAIDEIRLLDDRASRAERREVVESLRRGLPDAVFAFTPTASVYALARRIGAPLRVGFGYRSRPLDRAVAHFTLSHPVFSDVPEAIERADEVPHHAEELLRLLDAVGLADTRRPMEVPIAESDREWAQRTVGGARTPPIVLHLSHKWLHDGWTAADVVALVENLARPNDGRSVVLTVGPADREVWSAVRPLLLSREGVVALEGMTFGQWAAIIAAADLVVSLDTGAIHLASATQRPVVGVYAAHRFHVFSRQWGPWMVPNRTLPKARGMEGVERIVDAAAELLSVVRPG